MCVEHDVFAANQNPHHKCCLLPCLQVQREIGCGFSSWKCKRVCNVTYLVTYPWSTHGIEISRSKPDDPLTSNLFLHTLRSLQSSRLSTSRALSLLHSLSDCFNVQDCQNLELQAYLLLLSHCFNNVHDCHHPELQALDINFGFIKQ